MPIELAVEGFPIFKNDEEPYGLQKKILSKRNKTFETICSLNDTVKQFDTQRRRSLLKWWFETIWYFETIGYTNNWILKGEAKKT